MFVLFFFQLMFTFASRQVLKDYSRADYDWSYMIAWIGVGFALISSILFSCAAICLRREREKEEAVNMQYLMPGADIQMSLSFLFPSMAIIGQFCSLIDVSSDCRVRPKGNVHHVPCHDAAIIRFVVFQ